MSVVRFFSLRNERREFKRLVGALHRRPQTVLTIDRFGQRRWIGMEKPPEDDVQEGDIWERRPSRLNAHRPGDREEWRP